MKEMLLAVPMEVPVTETWGMNSQQVAEYLLRVARSSAQKKAEADGGRLIETSGPVEVSFARGTHTLLGVEYWLGYTTWRAMAPERVREEA